MTPTNAEPPLPPVARTSKVHLAYLDGVRGCAALYVVMHHMMWEIWPHPGNFHGLSGLVQGLFFFGHQAVGLFIVLSGFCLMIPVSSGDGTLRRGAWHFFQRRARRILPTYYCALAFSLLLIFTLVGQKTGTHWDVSLPVTLHGVVTHLLMLQDVFDSGQINHTHWSVAVEWNIYFAFPLVVLLTHRYGGFLITGIAAVVSGIVYIALAHSFLEGLNPQYWFLFTLGTLAASIAFSSQPTYQKLRARCPFGLLTCLFALLTVGGLWAQHLGHKNSLIPTIGWQSFLTETLTGLTASCWLIALSQQHQQNHKHKLGVRSWAEARPIVWLGTFAYSLYLVHAPLVQVVWQYFVHPLHLSAVPAFSLLMLLGVPLIVGVSYVFFLFAEKPFLGYQNLREQ